MKRWFEIMRKNDTPKYLHIHAHIYVYIASPCYLKPSQNYIVSAKLRMLKITNNTNTSKMNSNWNNDTNLYWRFQCLLCWCTSVQAHNEVIQNSDWRTEWPDSSTGMPENIYKKLYKCYAASKQSNFLKKAKLLKNQIHWKINTIIETVTLVVNLTHAYESSRWKISTAWHTRHTFNIMII